LRAKGRLFEVREKRPKPFRDEKILTSWGALMIGRDGGGRRCAARSGMIVSAERAFAQIETRLVTRSADGKSARALRLVKGEVVKGPGSSTTTRISRRRARSVRG